MHSTKNTPRTPEEQQKALEEFLASQERESKGKKDKKTKKKGNSGLSAILRTSKKLSREEVQPATDLAVKDTLRSPLSPLSKRLVIPKVEIQSDDRSQSPSHPSNSEEEEPTALETMVISKTSKNRPLTPEEQQKAFESYLATLEKEKSHEKEPVIAKATKNQPLTPEEQQKALGEYLASMDLVENKKGRERVVSPRGKSSSHEKDTPSAVIMAKTTKNKPLTPEEQQKAFEDYLATLEKEKGEKEPVIAKTTKNRPLTPEEQQKAFEEYEAAMKLEQEQEKEKDNELIIAKTTKNRPLTPEEQQKAFEAFEAAIKLEQEKQKPKSTMVGTKKNAPRTIEEQKEEMRKFISKNEVSGPQLKVSIKNRPLTPEEQQIALMEFRARKRLEEKPRLRVNDRGPSLSNRFSRALFSKGNPRVNTAPIVEEKENFSPLPKGVELTQFLLYNYNIVAAILEASKNINQQDVVNSILQVFATNRVEQKLIMWCLQKDLDRNEMESTLFRDNTPGTQLFSAYCKLKGRDYLENILAVYFERLMYRKEAVEVDPCRCSDEAAEENTVVLHELVNEILDRTFISQHQFPRCLGRLFHELQTIVAEKYPEQVAKMSGGFYFLRFFSPMALSPKANGLMDHDISAGCRRSLILCTKIIQNISNNVLFKPTEKYMLPFNDIIQSRQEDIRNFLLSLGDYDELKDRESTTTEQHNQNLLNKSLRILASSVASNFKQIQEMVGESGEGHDKLVQLRIIIEQIHNIEPIGWVPPEDVADTKDTEPEEDSDFEVSRTAFILLREAFQQCEAELRETKIRLEEETILRKSMQTIVVQLADSIHSQIDDRVAFKLEQVSTKAREAGIDQQFCNEILELVTPTPDIIEEPQDENQLKIDVTLSKIPNKPLPEEPAMEDNPVLVTKEPKQRSQPKLVTPRTPGENAPEDVPKRRPAPQRTEDVSADISHEDLSPHDEENIIVVEISDSFSNDPVDLVICEETSIEIKALSEVKRRPAPTKPPENSSANESNQGSTKEDHTPKRRPAPTKPVVDVSDSPAAQLPKRRPAPTKPRNEGNDATHSSEESKEVSGEISSAVVSPDNSKVSADTHTSEESKEVSGEISPAVSPTVISPAVVSHEKSNAEGTQAKGLQKRPLPVPKGEPITPERRHTTGNAPRGSQTGGTRSNSMATNRGRALPKPPQ